MLDLPEELTRTVSGLYERTATTLAMSDSSSEDLLSWTVAIITDGGADLEGGNGSWVLQPIARALLMQGDFALRCCFQ